MQEIINLIINNKEFVGIIVAIVGVVTPFAMFLLTKRKEQRQINFERFHKNLMNGLSNQAGTIGLDEQVAIIYELRNYREYFPVVKRILNYQIKRWGSELKANPQFEILITEAKETIQFIGKNWIKRYLSRYSKI